MNTNNISHYRILDKLGAGGMGEVNLADDTGLERRVALKLVPASYQYDPERREPFLREARAVSALTKSPGLGDSGAGLRTWLPTWPRRIIPPLFVA